MSENEIVALDAYYALKNDFVEAGAELRHAPVRVTMQLKDGQPPIVGNAIGVHRKYSEDRKAVVEIEAEIDVAATARRYEFVKINTLLRLSRKWNDLTADQLGAIIQVLDKKK